MDLKKYDLTLLKKIYESEIDKFPIGTNGIHKFNPDFVRSFDVDVSPVTDVSFYANNIWPEKFL